MRCFCEQTPIFEQMLIDDGILLRKYWFSVSDDEQLRRFRKRLNDPVRQWKLSPMDLESIYRWEDYSRAKDEMMAHTDTSQSPWYVVESDIKKHARLNMMSHLLSTIDYHDVDQPKVELPDRPMARRADYQRPARGSVDLCRRPRRDPARRPGLTPASYSARSAGLRPGHLGHAAAPCRRRVDVPGQRHRVRGHPDAAGGLRRG